MPRTDPDATANVIIRYLALCGAVVAVTRDDGAGYNIAHRAECAGCLSGSAPDTLHNTRDWASKHAAACRALPQPDREN